jgi:hypothetical protein
MTRPGATTTGSETTTTISRAVFLALPTRGEHPRFCSCADEVGYEAHEEWNIQAKNMSFDHAVKTVTPVEICPAVEQ